jgi:hypothetical protein
MIDEIINLYLISLFARKLSLLVGSNILFSHGTYHYLIAAVNGSIIYI